MNRRALGALLCAALVIFGTSQAFAKDDGAKPPEENPEITKLKNDYRDSVNIIENDQSILLVFALIAQEDEKIADHTKRLLTDDLMEELDDAGVALFKGNDLIDAVAPLMNDDEKLKDPSVFTKVRKLVTQLYEQATKVAKNADDLTAHLVVPPRIAQWRKDAGPPVPRGADKKK